MNFKGGYCEEIATKFILNNSLSGQSVINMCNFMKIFMLLLWLKFCVRFDLNFSARFPSKFKLSQFSEDVATVFGHGQTEFHCVNINIPGLFSVY